MPGDTNFGSRRGGGVIFLLCKGGNANFARFVAGFFPPAT